MSLKRDKNKFKKNRAYLIKNGFKIIEREISSKHKTRGRNTPTGSRHCVFEGVVEGEK